MLYHLPIVQLPSTTPPTYPLPATSSSQATLHSSSSSSHLALGLIQTCGIPISILRLPDWKTEVVEPEESSMITRDNNYRRLLLAVSPVDHRLRRTGIYLGSL